MSDTINVFLKGGQIDRKAINAFLEKAVKEKNEKDIEQLRDFGSIDEDNDIESIYFYTNIEKGKNEFELYAEGTEDYPSNWYNDIIQTISKSFAEIGFFMSYYWFSEDDDSSEDEGFGTAYSIYKNGKQIEKGYFCYDAGQIGQGAEHGGIAKSQIIADAYKNFIDKKFSLWLIEDSNDINAVKEAKTKISLALKNCKEIEKFLLKGDFDDIAEQLEEGILILPSKFHLLQMMDGYSSYQFEFEIDYVINSINTIDFSTEENPEKIKKLPDLSAFLNLKKLILTGTSIKKLPEYLQEKADDGSLTVIWE